MCCQVRMYGGDDFTSSCLSGAQLADSSFLIEAATTFPSPPALSQTTAFLKRHVLGSEDDANAGSYLARTVTLTSPDFPVGRLTAVGTTALGPAALLAIAKASRQPGSKVRGGAYSYCHRIPTQSDGSFMEKQLLIKEPCRRP